MTWFYQIFWSSPFRVRWSRRVVLFSMFLVVRRTEVIMRFPLYVVLLACKMYSLNRRLWVHSSGFFSQEQCLTSISRLFLCHRSHDDHSATLNHLLAVVCFHLFLRLVSLFDPRLFAPIKSLRWRRLRAACCNTRGGIRQILTWQMFV